MACGLNLVTLGASHQALPLTTPVIPAKRSASWDPWDLPFYGSRLALRLAGMTNEFYGADVCELFYHRAKFKPGARGLQTGEALWPKRAKYRRLL